MVAIQHHHESRLGLTSPLTTPSTAGAASVMRWYTAIVLILAATGGCTPGNDNANNRQPAPDSRLQMHPSDVFRCSCIERRCILRGWLQLRQARRSYQRSRNQPDRFCQAGKHGSIVQRASRGTGCVEHLVPAMHERVSAPGRTGAALARGCSLYLAESRLHRTAQPTRECLYSQG